MAAGASASPAVACAWQPVVVDGGDAAVVAAAVTAALHGDA